MQPISGLGVSVPDTVQPNCVCVTTPCPCEGGHGDPLPVQKDLSYLTFMDGLQASLKHGPIGIYYGVTALAEVNTAPLPARLGLAAPGLLIIATAAYLLFGGKSK